jgi:hypothetical protein
MKALVAAVFLTVASNMAIGAESPVKFHLTVKKDGHVLESPTFLAAVGQPVTLRLKDGLTVEALAKPIEADGQAWTRVRITYFETPDSRFVQEMSMHHPKGQRTGSFEYTDPSKRRFVIDVGSANN